MTPACSEDRIFPSLSREKVKRDLPFLLEKVSKGAVASAPARVFCCFLH